MANHESRQDQSSVEFNLNENDLIRYAGESGRRLKEQEEMDEILRLRQEERVAMHAKDEKRLREIRRQLGDNRGSESEEPESVH